MYAAYLVEGLWQRHFPFVDMAYEHLFLANVELGEDDRRECLALVTCLWPHPVDTVQSAHDDAAVFERGDGTRVELIVLQSVT